MTSEVTHRDSGGQLSFRAETFDLTELSEKVHRANRGLRAFGGSVAAFGLVFPALAVLWVLVAGHSLISGLNVPDFIALWIVGEVTFGPALVWVLRQDAFFHGPTSLTVSTAGLSILFTDGRTTPMTWRGRGSLHSLADWRGTRTGAGPRGEPCRVYFGTKPIAVPGAACEAILNGARSAGLEIRERKDPFAPGFGIGKGFHFYLIRPPRAGSMTGPR
jgi:hypothetical protein